MKKKSSKKKRQIDAQISYNIAYSASCWGISEHQFGSLFMLATFIPTFYPFSSAQIIALELSICDDFYLAFKDIGICKAECSCLIGPRQGLSASGRLPRRRCRKLFACHRFDHPPCLHRRSSGKTRFNPRFNARSNSGSQFQLLHLCVNLDVYHVAVTVATPHFSRFPFAPSLP